jgi:hypothetical protein
MKYKITSKIDAGSGFLKDSTGKMVSLSNFTPKVGDVIEGQITQVFLGNQNQRGMEYFISSGPGGETQKIFIPESKLKLLPDNYVEPEKAGFFSFKNPIILIGIVAVVGFFAWKKFKH